MTTKEKIQALQQKLDEAQTMEEKFEIKDEILEIKRENDMSNEYRCNNDEGCLMCSG